MKISASEQLAQWDRRIESFCVHVNQILDKIQAVHPDWCLTTMTRIEAKLNAASNGEETVTVEEMNPTESKQMDTS